MTNESNSPVIISGAKLSGIIRKNLAAKINAAASKGLRPPGLAMVLVGDNPASQVYVSMKGRACEKAGFHSRTEILSEESATSDVLEAIGKLNEDPDIDGMLVQLPLPARIDSEAVLAGIRLDKDADGFHPYNVGRLLQGSHIIAPATPTGIVRMLDEYQIPVEGAEAVIIGRSDIVGKPLAALLLHRNATVTLCHSRTRSLSDVSKRADILIVAIGRPYFITPDFIKPGAAVIDVGTNQVSPDQLPAGAAPPNSAQEKSLRKSGYAIVGDVDYYRALSVAGAISPVPKGVGPMTIASLLANTYKLYDLHTA